MPTTPQNSFQKSTLDNRITLLTENLPHSRSVGIGVWIPYGSRAESSKVYGAAHMIEHMLFKGTSDMNPRDIAVAFENVGASFNAAASREHTYLYARVLTDHLPLALRLLSAMALDSVFLTSEFDMEKNVVLEEISAQDDTPEDISYDYFHEDVYGREGLGHGIMGYNETVSAFSRDELFGIYKKIYRPAHLIISIAGNTEGKDLPAMVSQAFGADDNEPCASLTKSPPPALTTSVRLIPRDTRQVQLYAGFPGVTFNSEHFYTYSMLDMILSGGMSSRLFQEVREKRGLVYDISSDHNSYSDAGLFYICAGTSLENMEEVLSVSVDEINKIKNGEVIQDELSRVKEQFRSAMIMSHESVVSRMNRIARNEMYFGRNVSDEEILDNLGTVTLEDLAEAAARIFRPDPSVFTALGPFDTKPAAGIQDKIVDVLNRLY